MEKSGRSILVTGGAGFIGSHLCRALIRQGHKVFCLDNLYTGSLENIKDLMDDPDFVFAEADVTCLASAMSGGSDGNTSDDLPRRIDRIYHLACPASPVQYRRDPVYTAKTCFLGALGVLELAERMNARVLLTSTSEVYGDPDVHPQTESYRGNVNPIGPRACYDEGKRISETLFFDFYREKKVDIRVVRVFNTYGPCMQEDDGRIVSNFIAQALRGEDITIYGSGSQTRSFCYVEDMVRGLICMMENEFYVGPVNLGNPEERTVLSAAHEILRQTGTSSRLTFRPLPEDDPTRRRPDISRARDLLGWEPAVGFREGIGETVAYFRERLDDKTDGGSL